MRASIAAPPRARDPMSMDRGPHRRLASISLTRATRRARAGRVSRSRAEIACDPLPAPRRESTRADVRPNLPSDASLLASGTSSSPRTSPSSCPRVAFSPRCVARDRPASPPAPSAVLRSRRRFAAHARFRSGQHTFSKRRRRAANARSGTPSPPILTPSPRPPRRYRRLSGAGSACSSPADGSTTPSTGRSPTSCCTGAWGAPSGTRAARLRARFFKRRRGRSRETRADLARIRSRTTRRAPPPRSLAIAGERYPRVPPPSTRGAPVLLAPRRSDRDAPTLTSPISLPPFRGRRTLNYGQPALTDAANKVNAQ